MRTQDEIQAKAGEGTAALFNFMPEVLVPYLDYEHAKGFLKEGTPADQWDSDPVTREVVLNAAKTYMRDYGWPKCTGHRGISAHRTIQKMEAWMWLLGEDELVAVCKDEERYPQYGAPILKVICEKLGWPMPDDADALRMMRGEPCGSHEGCGCG